MRELFSIEELKQPAIVKDESGIIIEKFLSAHDRKIEGLRKLAGGLPSEGEIFFMWTLNSFNAFTFIPYVIKHSGTIEELTIATYSISTRIIDALMKIIGRGNILKVHLLISDSLPYRLPRVHDHLQALTANRNEISVSYAWNHSKIALMKTKNSHYIVEGSGNFGENAQHEQYIFLNSKQVYDFRKNEIHVINGRTTSKG